MVNLTILNILFIGLFISLVKLIYEEIKVKLNQKASRIILASKLNIKETILILNLKQILHVWILITLIKLGDLDPYPGKDIVLIIFALMSIKILNVTKETLIPDISGVFSTLLLGIVLGMRSSGSLIEAGSDVVSSLTLGIPFLGLLLFFSMLLLLSSIQMKTLLPVIISVILTIVMLSSAKKYQFKSILLLAVVVLAILTSLFVRNHQGSQNKKSHIPIPMEQTNSISNSSEHQHQEHNLNQFWDQYKERLLTEITPQETIHIHATSGKRMLEIKRDFLIISYKSYEHQCELDALDINDRNILVKAILKLILPLPRRIFQYITANGLFSSLKLQGVAPNCKSYLGRQITASILKIETYDNKTCSHLGQGEYKCGRSLFLFENIVSSLLSKCRSAVDNLFL